ncbi:ABC transporter ATP-binding protein [Algihabitans albus]|uniref:ABC transporter ATP-binding protein n=1 Tax=Algihabitans albus TaxID=2164067 RepID=UPI000E5CBF09|nr:ABC transporter ATP-binding protein [Algihabitans albus]
MTVASPNRIQRTGDDRPVSGLYQFVWRMSGWRQATAVLLSLIVAGLSVVPLELQRRILDQAVADNDLELLWILAASYLGVVLANGGIKLGLRLYQSWMSESAILYCRRHLADLHRAKQSQATDKGTAITIVNKEIEAVGGFVGPALSDPARHVGLLVSILGYMAIVEPLIAFVSLAFLAPQVALAPIIQRKLNTLIEDRIDLLRSISEQLADTTSDTSKSPGFRQKTLRVYGNRMRFFFWKFSGKAVLNLMNSLAPLSVLVLGGWMVVEGRTEIGVVVAFMSGFHRLAEPLRELIAYYRLSAQTAVQHALIARWMMRDGAVAGETTGSA